MTKQRMFFKKTLINDLTFRMPIYYILAYILRVCTQKDGDAHEKFNFLEIQELRPLKTCQKHFLKRSYRIFF